MKLTEKEIDKNIGDHLIRLRIPHSKTNVARIRDKNAVFRFANGTKGWPDYCAVLPDGRFWGIEVKAHDGRLSPEQKAVHEEIRKHGGVAEVYHSAHEVHEFYLNYKKERGL